MNDLNKLKESLLINNNSLNSQKEEYLNSFINLDLENNVISQINEDLINYFKNNLNNLTLTNDEIISINKSFNYFTSINILGIDLSNLYFEDKKLINLKNNIKLLYNKLLEYKNMIISQLEFKINSNNKVLENIKKIEEIISSDNINLDEVHDLINLLPLNDKIKSNIYKEIYNKYITILKRNDRIIEVDASELLERIILETELSSEIDERIEEDGIKLEINDEDRKLQDLILKLKFNVKKLNSKFPTDAEIKNKTSEELEIITKDKVTYSKLDNDIKVLLNEFENYLQSKDNIWNRNEYNQDELEEYLHDLFNELVSKYELYNQIYNKLHDKYKDIHRDVESVESNDENISNVLTPIIFFVDGVDRFLEGTSDDIPKSLVESLEKNKKFISKIKNDLQYLKQRDFSKLTTDLIDGVKYKFREIKVVNRTKNDLAIRVYYKFASDANGTSYPVVFMIYAKSKSKPQEIYEHISNIIGSKYFNDFLHSLPEQSKIDKILELERLVYDKIEELESQKIQNQLNEGGNSR